MELKTNVEYLKRVAKQAEQLVNNLKDYVFSQGIDDGTRGKIEENEAKKLTRLISGKLEGITVNGNEDILDDIITIYDNAIKSIDEELAKSEKLEDGNLDKFNKATIDSFNEVKKVLESSKGKKAEPLKIALDELVEEKSNGTIDQEYSEIKIEEVELEESSIQEEIKGNTEGLNKFELATRKEREALEATLKLSKEYFDIKKEIDEIDDELKSEDLTDEDKKKLEDKKAGKEKELVSVFKKFDEKYEKDDEYKQKENESDMDYLHRMEEKDGNKADMQVKMYVTLKQGNLTKKIETLKGQQIKIYDETKKEFKDINIEDYIDVDKGEELNNLSKKIMSDKLLNREGVKEQRDRLNELKKQKENYTERESYTETNGQNLPVEATKGMGLFKKFGKRRDYYKNQGDGRVKSFFKGLFSRKKDEEIFASEINDYNVPKDVRKQFLADLEEGAKKGMGKDEMKRSVKAKLFKDMDRANEEKDDEQR